MPELNPPQAQAVSHTSGPLLVFAGAGSGKTRVITYRVANLLAEHGVAPYRILAVTFTNKAAGEMRERLKSLAGEAITRDLWLGTFHSVCARLLRIHHDEVGLSRHYLIYDDSDQRACVSRILKELGLSDRELPPRLALSRIRQQKQQVLSPEDVTPEWPLDDTFVDIYRRYEEALKRADAVDFEDLILHVMRLAEDPLSPAGQKLRGRFSHVLVDEFQDTNSVQYRLVRALAAGTRNLCVVGDDDQSIYRWRGADVRNIRGFQKDFSDASVIKLEQNYRSTGNIVRGALGVIAKAMQREPKQLFTESESGDAVRVRCVTDEREEAFFVSESIRAEISSGTDPAEIAVFYRVHAQSRVLEELLRSSGISYQVIGGTKFFDRAEVKNLLAYLRLISTSRSDADLLRIINTPARGIGQKTVDHLLAIAEQQKLCVWDALGHAVENGTLSAGATKKVSAFRDLIAELRVAARTHSPHDLAGFVLDQSGYRKALERDDSVEGDARMENLAEFLGSIADFELECEAAGDPPTLEAYLERVSLVAAVDTMEETSKVALMTVHAAKGLEFESVYLTGMEEETFPYRGLKGDDKDAAEELDEERRLAYVAITRARRRLVVTHANCRTLFGRTRLLDPSRFVNDLPQDVVRLEGGRRRQAAWQQGLNKSPQVPKSGQFVDKDAFNDLPEDEAAPQAGDLVQHKRFGEGVVESVDFGAEPTIVARFPGWGVKRVRARFLTF